MVCGALFSAGRGAGASATNEAICAGTRGCCGTYFGAVLTFRAESATVLAVETNIGVVWRVSTLGTRILMRT